MELLDAARTVSASSSIADLYDYSDVNLSRIVLQNGKVPLAGTFYFREDIYGHRPFALSIVSSKDDKQSFKKLSRGKLLFYIETIDHSGVFYHFRREPNRSDRWDGTICGMCCVSKTQFKSYLKSNGFKPEDFTADNVLSHLEKTTAEAMTAYANGWLYSGLAEDLANNDGLSSYELFTEEKDALSEPVRMCKDNFGVEPNI